MKRKFTKKWQIVLYGCAGLGVNMLNVIVGTYLCSALLIGGFDPEDVGFWTYADQDLVVAGLWSVMVLFAKVLDGVIDLPLASLTDNLKTRWGKRRISILIGYLPMIVFYLLFLIPIDPTATWLNTVWFAVLLCLFYSSYTLTMLTYYATFSEVLEKKEDILLLSNVKSVCDVIYFIFGYALLPVFVGMDMNIRVVALLFLPLALTMLIPLFMLKEKPTNGADGEPPQKRVPLRTSLSYAVKNRSFLYWMLVIAVMNLGLQLFLTGINEFFSATHINMTFVMACSFAPVPFTILLYNKIVKSRGLGFGFRYILLTFSVGMLLMFVFRCLTPTYIPEDILMWLAMGCGIIVSFAIGAFFSVTYIVPSHLAAVETERTGVPVASMYYAVQGLFQGVSTGIASGLILVALKQTDMVHLITLIVALACLTAFAMSFAFPKSITMIGKQESSKNVSR